MPNLPKPRLRRATRRGEQLAGTASQAEPQTPNAEQIDSASVSLTHYRVIFKPSTIVPDVDAR